MRGSRKSVFVQVCMNRVADETDLYNRKENNAPQAISSATEMAVEAKPNTWLTQYSIPKKPGDLFVLLRHFV